MSLNNLPIEIFHLTAGSIDTRDHLNLFLVSKKIRSYAQSSIQLELELTITWKGQLKSQQETEVQVSDDPRRDRFFQGVETSPHLLSYLTSLTLVIDPSIYDKTSRLGQATIELLKGAVRLSTLHFTRPHLTGSGSLSFAIFDAIPSSVTRIVLEGSPINMKGLEYVLTACPSIRTLDLARSGIIEFDKSDQEEDLRFPPTLTTLKLPHYRGPWYHSLNMILCATTNLTTYSGWFFSARCFNSLALSRLTSLSLTAFHEYDSQQRTTAEVNSTLVALLDKTPGLVKLHIDLGYYFNRVDHTVPPVAIIDHLPTKLHTLSIQGNTFYTNHDLLLYLASPARSPQLSRLCLPGGNRGEDEDIKERCQDRGIRVTFGRWY
ncbi:hypothetical protein JCM5350_006997 [Sporobolomyces pararoseus]